MIFELFGPPGAGKTTFAHALAAWLQERGEVAELVLSQRPAERAPHPDPCATVPPSHQVATAIRRLSRPVSDMLSLARNPSVNSPDVKTAATLLKLLPPKSMIWSIRLSQYITRLSHSWARAAQARHIVLFDQAFIQVICSLALLGRTPDRAMIAHALECTPQSDLLISVEAPYETLLSRLRERERLQGRIERLFELDLQESLASVRIIDQLHVLLQKRKLSTIYAFSLDRRSFPQCVNEVGNQIMAKLDTERGGVSQ
jgi:thymidylate kinase